MNLSELEKELQERRERDAIRLLMKYALTVGELAEELKITGPETKSLIVRLKDRGLNVATAVGGRFLIHQVLQHGGHLQLSAKPDSDGWLKFGFLTDNHLANKHSRLDVLRAAYNTFEAEGITEVFNAGNFVDGEFRFNRNELLVFGMDAQLKYWANEWPEKKGITTYFITGDDHEGWWSQRELINVGEHAEDIARKEGRLDLRYIGHVESDIELKCGKNSEVMRIMHPGGGSAYAYCYDSATEILTSDGWVSFPKLKIGVPVATLNPKTNELEFQVPDAYTNQLYFGPMVQFIGSQYDLSVTPTHRMWVRRPYDRHPSCNITGRFKPRGYRFVEAKDVNERGWCLRKSAKWVGRSIKHVSLPMFTPKKDNGRCYNFPRLPVKPFLNLLGWYVSEGNLNHANHQVEISQCNSVVLQEIADLASELGYKPYIAKGNHKVIISSTQLYEYLKPLGLSSDKYVFEWIKSLSPALIWEFLETYLRGDGCKAPRTGGELKWHSASTVSRRLADDLQELLIKVGHSATVQWKAGVCGNTINGHVVMSAQDSYVISINYEFLEPVLNLKKSVHYSGRIYCVSTKNGIVLVRRNGKATFCGNSYAPQKLAEMYQGSEKPRILLIGHYHKFDVCFPREIHVISGGCTTDQSLFMRKNKIAAHVGYSIIWIKQNRKHGHIERVRVEWVPFYDRNFYERRFG